MGVLVPPCAVRHAMPPHVAAGAPGERPQRAVVALGDVHEGVTIMVAPAVGPVLRTPLGQQLRPEAHLQALQQQLTTADRCAGGGGRRGGTGARWIREGASGGRGGGKLSRGSLTLLGGALLVAWQ